MKYKHIIWDWNGTLVDDAWLCVEIMNGVLRQYKLKKISLFDYKRDFVFPVKNYYALLGFDFDKTPFDVCGLDFIKAFKKRKFDAPLFELSIPLISSLKQKNLHNYILSASHQSILNETIDFFDLRSYFSSICGLTHFKATSKVEEGHKLLSSIACDKSLVLMVGDTLHDFEVAEALNVDCVLVSHGHNSKQRLKQTAAPVFSGFFELASYLNITIN